MNRAAMLELENAPISVCHYRVVAADNNQFALLSNQRRGAQLQELYFRRVWCKEDKGMEARFAHLLLCTYQLELQLGATGGSRGLMASLHRRLHESALQLAGSTHETATLLLPEMCAASAAAGLLMRMCGDIQAFRKLLCDLLLECEVRPRHALPAFAAAADAWPGCLPPAHASDAARLWSAAADTAARDHSDCGVALMHSIAFQLCASQSASARARNDDDEEDSSLAADLAVLYLQHIGQTLWNWRQLVTLHSNNDKPADSISGAEAWGLLSALHREAEVSQCTTA